MSDNILELRDITFAYSGSDETVLNSISLGIEKGSFNLIFGESGSGKSTLLKLIKKSMNPAGRIHGEILYCGRNINELTIREEVTTIGFVQQSPDNQLVTDKVWHELSFGLENLGLSNSEIRRRVAEMAEYFGITSWYERDVNTLSGGQKQILNLAAVMVMQPKILLLDEPTAQLDPLSREKFLDTLINLNKDLGITVICVEHNLENIYSHADNCIALKAGEILYKGEPVSVARELISNKEQLSLGLPSSVRIYEKLCSNISKDIPLSVREGRRWINSQQLTANVENNSDDDAELNKSDIAIELKNLMFSYDKSSQPVIKNLDMTIERGKITSILGGNGAGKSTLLKLIVGVNKVKRGKVKCNGRVIYLPQNPQAVFTEISVEEELAEVLMDNSIQENKSESIEEKKKKVDAMLIKLSLINQRKQHPYDLSGGQQQKLALGKILLMNPDIILLDEPTKGLDPFFKRELGRWLRELSEMGITIVIVSHDVEFSADFADRCALLFDGQISSEDTSNRFFVGNMFFTTNINRIMSEKFNFCVNIKDIEKLVNK